MSDSTVWGGQAQYSSAFQETVTNVKLYRDWMIFHLLSIAGIHQFHVETHQPHERSRGSIGAVLRYRRRFGCVHGNFKDVKLESAISSLT
jgi:hypothetical protein